MEELHGCRLVIRFENNCVVGCLFGGLTPFVTALIACLSGSALSVQAGCQIGAALVAHAYRGHKDGTALSRISPAAKMTSPLSRMPTTGHRDGTALSRMSAVGLVPTTPVGRDWAKLADVMREKHAETTRFRCLDHY